MFIEALAVLVWTLAVAGIGCWLGLVIGQENIGRRSAEAQVEELRQQLANSRPIRAVLNDTHKRVVAVSKGLEKQAS
jgi:hypothetical protein